jgi:hypothetical protein
MKPATDIDEAIGHQHHRADEQDLQHRHRCDGRVDLPFQILQDRNRKGGAAGADQEQAHFQISERGDEAEQGRGDDARQNGGQGDAAERGQSVGAEALGGFLHGAVHAGEARGDQPHGPGDREQDVAGDQSAERAEHRPASGDLGLDKEYIERDAEHDARHDQGQQQQIVDGLTPGEAGPHQAECSGNTDGEADRGCDQRDLQAQDEAGDKPVVAGDSLEPFQRVAFGRK